MALRAAWHFTIDDSGISFAYAKHIASGDGPVAAVGGPWVEGYSNALWVFLLVPFHWLNLPLAGVSKVLGVVGLLLTLWAGAGILLRSRPKPPLDALVVTFWALGMVVCLEVAVWTVAGLENALLCALLIGMAYFDVREHEVPSRFPVSAVLAFCLCITRPEGPAYALPLLALKAAIAWRQPEFRPQLWRALVWFAAPLVLYHAVHYAVFREFVPNTYFAKPRSKSLAGGITYLRRGLKDSGLLYSLPLAAIGLIGQWRSKVIPAWIALFGAMFVLYSGGDWMPHARFISFFAPAVLLLATFGAYNCVVGAGALLQTLVVARKLTPFAARPDAFRHWATVGCLLLGTMGCGWRWQSFQLARLRHVKQAKYCHFCQRTEDSKKLQSLSKKAQLGSVSVLTHDFGGPSWLSDDSYYPIDFLGLCDATIPRLRNAKHALRLNYPLFAHLLHEQDNGPDWVYLPRNFFPRLTDLTEHNLAYVHLKANQLPYGPAGSYLELHRSKLVDFFPPFLHASKSVEARAVAPGLDLLGFEVSTQAGRTSPSMVGPDAPIRVSVVVLPRETKPEGELGIAINDDAVHRAVALDRGLGIGRYLLPGEPLRFDFELTLPAAPSGAYELRLAYSSRPRPKKTKAKQAAQHWTFTPLRELQPGTQLPVADEQRTLPRYPSALPSPSDSVLFDLQPKMSALLERSYGTHAQQRQMLAEELITRGKTLEGSDDEQAYLAYVWAIQVYPAAWRDLTKPLLRLRPPLNIADFGLEILFLREHYANPSDASKARLVAFYTSRNKQRQAEYFGSKAAGDDHVGSIEVLSLNKAELARWTGTLPLHSVEGRQLNVRTLLPGRVLSSDASTRRGAPSDTKPSDHAAQGELDSPPFELLGSRLTLMVGGGSASDRVGVELLVDGEVVHSGSGLSELDLYPIVWDVSAHYGKQAKLRVNDHNSRRSIYVGGIELWN